MFLGIGLVKTKPVDGHLIKLNVFPLFEKSFVLIKKRKMTKVMLSKLSLVTLIWKLNEMTQQEESHFVQDTTAIIQALSTKQGTGHVSFGRKVSL